jgi:regulator of replication initiation timing
MVTRWESRVKALEQTVDEQRKQLEDMVQQLKEVQLENKGLKARIVELEKENRELRLQLSSSARMDKVS